MHLQSIVQHFQIQYRLKSPATKVLEYSRSPTEPGVLLRKILPNIPSWFLIKQFFIKVENQRFLRDRLPEFQKIKNF